jgi:hypothetical protein
MQTMEAPSTEKRLDDLNVRMTEGFSRVDREIALGGVTVTLFLALAGLQGL